MFICLCSLCRPKHHFYNKQTDIQYTYVSQLIWLKASVLSLCKRIIPPRKINKYYNMRACWQHSLSLCANFFDFVAFLQFISVFFSRIHNSFLFFGICQMLFSNLLQKHCKKLFSVLLIKNVYHFSIEIVYISHRRKDCFANRQKLWIYKHVELSKMSFFIWNSSTN